MTAMGLPNLASKHGPALRRRGAHRARAELRHPLAEEAHALRRPAREAARDLARLVDEPLGAARGLDADLGLGEDVREPLGALVS